MPELLARRAPGAVAAIAALLVLALPPCCMGMGSAVLHGAPLAGASPARSLLAEDAKKPFKIFVYNMSKFRDNHEAWRWIHTSLYGLEMTFPIYLLDSPYVTTNPDEADYFYVWAWLYSSKFQDLKALLEELQKQPYWKRKGGKDHIFTIVHDQGLCDGPRFLDIKDSIILEHWGRVSGTAADNPCYLIDRWATDCDQVFKMLKEPEPKKPACYTAGKDIVVPTVVSETPSTTRYLSGNATHTGMANVTQNTLIIFGGGINQTHLTDPNKPENDAGYSFGVRQTFARLYHDHPEVKIFYHMVSDYWVHFHASIFCLAPAGWGWGARVKSAVTRGCIPVIIQDGIKVEWEDQLPMHEFALRVPFMYIHRLPEILHRVKRLGRVERMQRNLACVWRLYWWTRPHGRAFEMTMCTLKARLAGAQPEIDFGSCTLRCGPGPAVEFSKGINLI